MRTDEPLANLHRRLRLGPDSPPAETDSRDAGESDEPLEPSWVPNGLAAGADGGHWISAVRADPGRAGGIALAAIAVLAVLVTVFTLARQRPPAVVAANIPPVDMAPAVTTAAAGAPAVTTAAAAPTAGPLVVSVVGLVNQPGLVTLAPEARVADAVSAAGGPLRGADTLGLNLARQLADGEQIVVGIAAPAGRSPALGSSVGSAAVPEAPVAPSQPVGPLDLNTATAEQLDALPGVGPVTAAAIVAWRTANGRFASVDQLSEVDGIGPARLERLRPLVRV